MDRHVVPFLGWGYEMGQTDRWCRALGGSVDSIKLNFAAPRRCDILATMYDVWSLTLIQRR